MLVKKDGEGSGDKQSTSNCWLGVQRVREHERRSGGTVTGGTRGMIQVT